jgi:hypothetical protein
MTEANLSHDLKDTSEIRIFIRKLSGELLAEPNVQHRQQQSPPLDTILNQFHPPAILTTCLRRIYLPHFLLQLRISDTISE